MAPGQRELARIGRLGLPVLAVLLFAVAGSGRVASASGASAPPIGGLVTLSAVGPLPFGASVARVRRWAGAPEFTGPPVRSYPIPARADRALVLGYHCTAGGGSPRASCHTLFGFVRGRLATFSSDSPLFHLASGVRPGMKPADVERREPQARYRAGCAVFEVVARSGRRVEVSIAPWVSPRVFSLYVSRGPHAFAGPC